MSEMTFYIEEVQDGDPPPSPPPDGGESDEESDDFVDLGDLTGQLEDYIKPEDNEVIQQPSNNNSTNKKKNKKKKKSGKKNRGNGGSGGGGVVNTAGFSFGDRVELHGLVGKIELNGCLGEISSNLLPSGRFSILLDDGNGPFDLKPLNLKKTSKLPNSTWLLKSRQCISSTSQSSSSSSSSIKTNNIGPSGRGGASLTSFDNNKENNLCIFGGANRQGVHYNDLHILTPSPTITKENTKENAKEHVKENENDLNMKNNTRSFEWHKILKMKGSIPKVRSGHSMLQCQIPCTSSSTTVNNMINKSESSLLVLYGGSDLSTNVLFDDLFHLILAPDLSVEWRAITATGDIPAGRNAHTSSMVSLSDGSQVMVVFGGTTMQGPTNDIYILDQPGSSTPVWYKGKLNKNSLVPKPREMHAASTLPYNTAITLLNNKEASQKQNTSTTSQNRQSSCLLISGGRLGEVEVSSDNWLLSIERDVSGEEGGGEKNGFTCTWKQCPDLPAPRCGHTMSFLANETDKLTNSTTATTSAAAVSGGGSESNESTQEFLVVYGGIDGEAFTKETLLFDFASRKWLKKVFANDKERLGHASVVVSNKSTLLMEMVVFGGVNPTSDLDDVTALTPPITSATPVLPPSL